MDKFTPIKWLKQVPTTRKTRWW